MSESPCGRDESECLDVIWPHDIEMPVVQRGNFSESQALRDRDHSGIDDAEREIDVGLDKPGHASSHVTETVYRLQLRPVLQEGAEMMDRLFGAVSSGLAEQR